MGEGRDRIALRPLGTNALLRLAMPPTWHPVRRVYDWVGEVARGQDADTLIGWSWLVRVRSTGIYVELPADLRAARSLPQHKVLAALADLEPR